MTRIQKMMSAAALLFVALTSPPLMAVEEAEYRTLKADGKIELREYVPSVVAETMVSGDFEEAGSRAFRRLFNYIDGYNESADKIAMTAPVTQQTGPEDLVVAAQRTQFYRSVVSEAKRQEHGLFQPLVDTPISIGALLSDTGGAAVK